MEALPAPALAEVAFAGRSNVGKSSLLNMLMQRRSLARASNTPGRTRQINVFDVKLATGLAVQFVDLPGFGFAKVSKAERKGWQPLIESYLAARPTLRAMFLLVDVRRGMEEDDAELARFVRTRRTAESTKPLEVIFVATKIDKLALAERKVALMAIAKEAGRKPIGASAVSGEGRDAIWKALEHAIL